ncbi:hypothetical protein M9Y10_003049 [Tritrichomonas musculus]|uniref:Protein kinase domain-containing protein n=1 Tax=Tritrichomonas musculus TaxID=1915356 RepID=A0ABR2JP55_9EUKA
MNIFIHTFQISVGHSKEQTTFGGTVEYMAPEIIRNQPYDGKVDVYSFGIIMYQVIGKCVAYPLLENKKMQMYQFQQKVAEENYRPHFDVDFNASHKLKELIEKCWSEKPEDRPIILLIIKNIQFMAFTQLKKKKMQQKMNSVINIF